MKNLAAERKSLMHNSEHNWKCISYKERKEIRVVVGKKVNVNLVFLKAIKRGSFMSRVTFRIILGKPTQRRDSISRRVPFLLFIFDKVYLLWKANKFPFCFVKLESRGLISFIFYIFRELFSVILGENPFKGKHNISALLSLSINMMITHDEGSRKTRKKINRITSHVK